MKDYQTQRVIDLFFRKEKKLAKEEEWKEQKNKNLKKANQKKQKKRLQKKQKGYKVR